MFFFRIPSINVIPNTYTCCDFLKLHFLSENCYCIWWTSGLVSEELRAKKWANWEFQIFAVKTVVNNICVILGGGPPKIFLVHHSILFFLLMIFLFPNVCFGKIYYTMWSEVDNAFDWPLTGYLRNIIAAALSTYRSIEDMTYYANNWF